MDISVLREILRGGLDKLREARVVLVGGHSVEDPELKFGLSVSGIVHPDRVLTNRGARAGDRLLLTKPLGTGIINTAVKAELATPRATELSAAVMAALNSEPARLMEDLDVHACTDVTGFGLVGHLAEMVDKADVGAVIHAAEVPCLPHAEEYCSMGLLPAGLHRNREFRAEMVETGAGLPVHRLDLLFDPQTSGGLLAALPAEQAEELLARLTRAGVDRAAVIGEVIASPAGKVLIR